MHPQVQRFLSEINQRLPEVVESQRVIEFGAFDINGTPRDLFALAAEYVGLDWRPGPGVDVVSLAHLYGGHPDGYFDGVVSTEMLEHDPFWRESVQRMVALVRPGGCLVLTCAGPQRPAHEMQCAPEAGYYAGISLLELATWVRQLAGWKLVWGEEHGNPSDTYLVAVGKEELCAQKVSVVVPAVNNSGLTARAIGSLRHHASRRLEIVLVDNGSTAEESRSLMTLWPDVYLRYDQPLGYPAAMNRGLAHASGEWIALANNDILMMTPSWDSALMAALGMGIGLASPVFDRVANPAQQIGTNDHGMLAALAREADVLFFVMVMGHRETFAAVGPLDERFGMGNSEDTDYSLRVREAGGQLLVAPGVTVLHAAHQTFGQMLSQAEFMALLERNQKLLHEKWGMA